MLITSPRNPKPSKPCPPALPESPDEEFEITTTPENHPSTFTIKGFTSFPRLATEVPSTWTTMNEDLSDYFWRNCSYAAKNYGFPKQYQQKPSKPTITTNFVQKSTLAKHKYVPGHNDVELFMGMSTEDLVQEAWKRLDCDVGLKKLKNIPRTKNIVEEAISSDLSKYLYKLPELPTYRRYFRPEAPNIAEKQRPKWAELGHEENLDFFPPEHNLKSPYDEAVSKEYSDIELFKYMSTEDLVELNWDRLYLEKEGVSDDSSTDSEDENPKEDMSELDAYFDYYSTINIPEKIPRLMIRFLENGSYNINYEPSKPKLQQKRPNKPPVYLRVLLYLYSIIVSLFFQPKKEEAPTEDEADEPILKPNQRLEATISDIQRRDFSCIFWEKLDKSMICTNEIKFKPSERSILVNISDGVKRNLMFFDALGQNPEDVQNQVTINIEVANFSLEKVNVSRNLLHEEKSIIIGVSGEAGEELDVKFITDAGDVIFDRTILALSNPEGNTCEVVKTSTLEEVELPVVTPKHDQKPWFANLPKELSSNLKEDSKFIEVAFRNQIDLTKVNCSCTSEANPKIILMLPVKFFTDIRYRISDGENTIEKLMTYSYGDYILEEQNPWKRSIDIAITLRNLSLNDFDHSWERINKFSPTPENFFKLKHNEKTRIDVFFKDDIGNYKIDDLSPPIPIQIDYQDRRKKVTVNLKNTLYKMSGTFSITRTPPYTLTCEVHHTLYDIIEPIRVTINDGKNFKEFFMLDEEDEVPDRYQKLIEIELSNGLSMGDISYSAITSRVNKTNTSTLKLIFSPKVRVPIVVDVTDQQNTDRCIIEKSSKVDCKLKETMKTVYVMMTDGLNLENVHFLVIKPLKVDGIWETNFFVTIHEDTTDDLVIWLVGAKEMKKMTVNRKEPKHTIEEETSPKPGELEPNSSQANLIIFLKKIPLANTSIISKQYDKNSSNDTIILTIFTKALVPIKLTTKVEDLAPEEHIFFEPQPKITTSMDVRIIKGLYLRDLEVSIKEIRIDDQRKGQEVLIKVQNPQGCWIVMSINDAKDILKIYSEDMTKAEEEAKEISLVISDDLKSSVISHFWETPRVLEEAMVFKITFACSKKIDIRTYPVRFGMEEVEDRLEELNLKVVDKLFKLQRYGKLDIEEREHNPHVRSDYDAIDLYDRYFKGDADFYRRLYCMYEGWKHGLMDIEDASEGYCAIEDGEGEDDDAKVKVLVAKKYNRGLPMVGFLMPHLTFSGLEEEKIAQPYQRCDMVYARYLGQYYKDGQNGDEPEYWDYSSGDEDDLEIEEAPQIVQEEISKDNKDTPTVPIRVPSIYNYKVQSTTT